MQETEADAVDRIVVDEILSKPHRLITAAQMSLTKSQPDTYGRMTTRNGDVDIRVGVNSIPRALRIMDALLKAFDARGFKLKFKEQYGLGSYVVIEGQSIQFSLDVASKRFDIPASQRSGLYGQKVGYTPTEVLRFRIQGDIFASDLAGFPLEKQLGSVVKTLIQTSVNMCEQEERRRKQAAVDRQDEIRRWEAEAQRKKLFEDMESWSRSEQLRGLISRLRIELEKDPVSRTEYAAF